MGDVWRAAGAWYMLARSHPIQCSHLHRPLAEELRSFVPSASSKSLLYYAAMFQGLMQAQ